MSTHLHVEVGTSTVGRRREEGRNTPVVSSTTGESACEMGDPWNCAGLPESAVEGGGNWWWVERGERGLDGGVCEDEGALVGEEGRGVGAALNAKRRPGL
jgi:hypothetical protein